MSGIEIGGMMLAVLALGGTLATLVLARRRARREADPSQRRLTKIRAAATLHALAMLMGLGLAVASLPPILVDPTAVRAWLLAAAGIVTAVVNAASLASLLFGPGWLAAPMAHQVPSAEAARDPELLAALHEGRLLPAIRRYRELTGTSLAEAKGAVEVLRDEINAGGGQDRGATSTAGVRQMRLVVEADDYERAVSFFRDALGLAEELSLATPPDARVTILQAGRATLELVNLAQKRMIDELEVGRQVAPRLRVAFEVPDGAEATARLVAAGARLVAGPVETPWRSRNARLDVPAGLHITVFEELDAE